MRALSWFAKPWQAPLWFFVLLLGFNRWILKTGFGSAAAMRWQDTAAKAASGAGESLIIGLLLAFCILFVLKTAQRRGPAASLEELFQIGLQAQAPYLLAAPLAVVVAAASTLGAEQARQAAEFCRGALTLGMFLTLYFLLRRRFAGLGEFKLITLTFSPYVLLIAAVLSAAVLFCSALILGAAYFIL